MTTATTTSTLAALKDRLAEAHAEVEWTYTAIYVTKPYSPEHVAAQGRWRHAAGYHAGLRDAIEILEKENDQ